jgi:hypothetical protein
VLELALGAESFAFSPASLPGLAVWLDAAQLGLADGAAVAAWPNLGSDAALVPTMLGTPLPVLKAGLLNGKPVVRFQTGMGGLRGRTSVMQDYTLIYVGRVWLLPYSSGRLYSGAYPESGNFLLGYHVSFGMDCMYDEAEVGSGVFPVTTDWRMYGADGNTVSGYQARKFVDGVLSGAHVGGTGIRGYYNLSGYSLTTASETGDFDVAELLIYNRQLADAERISVENYLRTKWGLPGALPDTGGGVGDRLSLGFVNCNMGRLMHRHA